MNQHDTFLAVFLANVTDAATDKPCQPQLQPYVAKLLACIPVIAETLLANLAGSVQLSYIAELLTC